jgi:Lecithin retinol acyltransferase
MLSSTTHVGVHWIERPPVAESELPIGAHVVIRRHGYTHHGIYAGAGKVVHYAGLSRGLRRGPVEENSLSTFAAGYPVSVVSGVPPKFEGREVVRRARSRIGEDNYRILTNNCEHFCEWCLRGQPRSYQIDGCLAIPSRALHVTRRLIADLLSLAGLDVQTRSKVPFSNFGNPAQWTGGSTLERSQLPHGKASRTGV